MGQLKRGFARVGAPALINLGSIGLSFVTRILLARAIGPAAFGVFSVWFNNVQLFGLAGMFGQQNHTLRRLARHDENAAAATDAALEVLRFCTASGLAAALAGAVFFVAFQDGGLVDALLQAAAVVALALITILSAIHRSFGSFVIGILFDRAIPQVAFFLVVVAALAAGWRLGNATGAFTATLALGLLPSLGYLLRRRALRLRRFLGTVQWRQQLAASLPFFLLSIGLVVNGRYLLGIAGIYFEGARLGAVGLLLTVVALILIPGTTFNLVFGPPIARAFAGGEPEAVRRVVWRYLAAVAVISLLAGLAIALGFERLEPIVGFDFSLSASVVALASATTVVAALAAALLFVLQMGGRANAAAGAVLLAVVLKVPVGLWAVPVAGLRGLLVADLLLGLALLGYLAWVFRRVAGRWQAQQ